MGLCMLEQNDYRFDSAGQGGCRQAGNWLKLGVATLFIAGLYAALLAVARTPLVKDIVPSDDFFHVSLVIHVIFSNIFWFLAVAGALWNMNARDRFLPLGSVAWAVTTIGVVILAVSPFAGADHPVMSNYIPFLNSPVFFVGLAVSGIGFTLLVVRVIVSVPKLMPGTREGSMRFGVYTAAHAANIAVLAFIWAFFTMPEAASSEGWYENLFWMGGHVLQFTHALLMLVAWMWLASASGVTLSASPRLVSCFFALALLTVAATPVAFVTLDSGSTAFQQWFTTHMQIGGAIATVPLGLVVLWSLLAAGKAAVEVRPLRIALIFSITLFALGGVMGFMLEESSTLVTAHYHSVTGAVTLAFMALVFDLLPRLGYGAVSCRLAKAQVYAYGVGQLLHVAGLAWAGGYGMQRKVAGSGQSLDNLAQTLGMSLMGIGGLIATIGGILFLLIVIQSMRSRS